MATAPSAPGIWPGTATATVALAPPHARAALRAAFDAMAGEYDDLRAPWYRHSLGIIDAILSRVLRPAPAAGEAPRALDVGCGTGIQSLRLARLGYRVLGVDLAPSLLAIARGKLRQAGHDESVFAEGDAVSLPAPAAAFDAVNCCGPTLSLVHRWPEALREMARCLKPGGRLLLEVEGKWSVDVLWEVVNALSGNRLGYDEPLGVALRHLMPPWREGHRIDYSLKLESGGAVSLPLKLFAPSELAHALRTAGLRPVRRWGIHALTNLIPSTVLHRADNGAVVSALFTALASLERRASGRWPVNALGCSLLVLAQKDA